MASNYVYYRSTASLQDGVGCGRVQCSRDNMTPLVLPQKLRAEGSARNRRRITFREVPMKVMIIDSGDRSLK